MARLELPSAEDMTAEQRAVCDEVVAGKRGKIPSPMVAWIRNPILARRAQQLGEVLRFGTTLEDRLVELAILVSARHWTAHQVWTSHVRYARQFGVDEAVIAAIADRRTPPFASDPDRIVHAVATAMLETGRIPGPLHAAALARFGERALVELVAVVGYYGLVSLTANAFELGLPTNAAVELRDPDHPGLPNP